MLAILTIGMLCTLGIFVTFIAAVCCNETCRNGACFITRIDRKDHRDPEIRVRV